MTATATGSGSVGSMTDDPKLPPRWRRLYAHIVSLDAACPRCGAMTATFRGKHNRAYDRRRALFACPVCGGRWYVGVIFWPARKRRARPWDHTPTPGEALKLRELSAVTEEAVAGVETGRARHTPLRVRSQVNLVCTCGGCAVHDPELMRGDDDAV